MFFNDKIIPPHRRRKYVTALYYCRPKNIVLDRNVGLTELQLISIYTLIQ
jgi:hypothetical protein